jgi:hypothetical protein
VVLKALRVKLGKQHPGSAESAGISRESIFADLSMGDALLSRPPYDTAFRD